LKNAFIQALMPSIDNEINIDSVDAEKLKGDKNLLQKIFTKNNTREKKRKK